MALRRSRRSQKVALPPYEDGCQDDPAQVACDYPETELKKIVSTSWVEEDSAAVGLVENFQWTNEDQNLVAKYISEDGMCPEDAAAKWVEDNQDTVDGWLAELRLRGFPRLGRDRPRTSTTAAPDAPGRGIAPGRARSTLVSHHALSCILLNIASTWS